MKSISIIIPVYNNPEKLKLTLDSILAQKFPLEELEVLIVDDGSQIDMKSIAEEYADRISVRYFWQEDLGFRPGTARNMGIREAKGKLCIFLDCDIIVTSHCFTELYQIYQTYGETSVILGYLYGTDLQADLDEMREVLDTYSPDEAVLIMEKRNMGEGRERTYAAMGDNLSQWPAPFTMLWGAFFAVPTSFMRENHIYFDEYFRTWGCEDNDFGIQLYQHGGRYILARKAKAMHYPAKVRSYYKMKNDPIIHEGWRQNREYLKKKYANNRLVQLWLEKGGWAANHPELEE